MAHFCKSENFDQIGNFFLNRQTFGTKKLISALGKFIFAPFCEFLVPTSRRQKVNRARNLARSASPFQSWPQRAATAQKRQRQKFVTAFQNFLTKKVSANFEPGRRVSRVPIRRGACSFSPGLQFEFDKKLYRNVNLVRKLVCGALYMCYCFRRHS